MRPTSAFISGPFARRVDIGVAKVVVRRAFLRPQVVDAHAA